MVDQYIYSGSLPENASTYVTRAADRELYIGLKEGKFCYVLNSRQSGKSSLRVRTMQRLRNDGVECAAIDLSAGGIQNVPPEQWYADLIDTLIDSFGLDVDFGNWWSEISDFTLVKRFRKFIEEILLAEIQENIVIFIDEIDSVISLNFPTDDFFAFIRACYNQRVDNPEYKRLTFCLLGVASPGNLIKDKNRTPFNIGKAISLVGFKLDEVEPLIRGLEGKFSDSQGVMAEILTWTGGQPFLTQKLCQFMVEESEKENPRTVEEVVKSRVIENWESQDEPEHLRTISSRILRNEERAGYLLELYQQIWRAEVESSITGDDTIEQSELLLSGLVARREGKLRVYNAIYKEVFNLNWVENELNNLRPYSEAFRAWVASGYSDESRLLGGKALEGAEKWAKGKNLSYQDKQFLAASKEKEIAVRNKEAELERERKDREAAEQRNQVLSEANVKAKRRIRNGTVVLVVALLGAVSLGGLAAIQGEKALKAQKNADDAKQEVELAKQQVQTEQKNAEAARRQVQTEQQNAKLAQQTAEAAKQEVKLAKQQAETEQKKALQAQQTADEANRKAEAAKQQAQTEQQNAKLAQQIAKAAKQDAQLSKKQAESEQKKALQAQQTADEANRKSEAAKQQAQIEQKKARQAQRIANEATEKAENLQNQFASVESEIKTVQALSKLAGELRNENLTADSDEALRQAGLSFRVKDHNLKQAMLLASISQAYEKLKKPGEAEKKINESLEYLNNKGNKISSDEGLQIKVLVKRNEGNLLAEKSPQQAIKAYQQAYEILKKHPTETNPFVKDKILVANDIELVHRGLLKLQSNSNQSVWNSLKEHFYAELENFLNREKPDWRAADIRTWRLMLFIADREKERWLDIPQLEKFSCPDLKRIDKLWVKNSKGHFGFSVQKKIWVKTGNRLGVKPGDWNDSDTQNYLRFANAVGWYNYRQRGRGSFVSYDYYMTRRLPGGLPGIGAEIGKWKKGYNVYPLVYSYLFSHCDL
ncbi:MAG: DUF3856 domain-containing protein [Calothrix sp. MO_192.B10]|nr:DUF3856 domain-containing protein [Calothrix sp. MO_192.B10]